MGGQCGLVHVGDQPTGKKYGLSTILVIVVHRPQHLEPTPGLARRRQPWLLIPPPSGPLKSRYHLHYYYYKVFNSELNIVNTNYSNRCCLISGPNGAGKTIYMKQLGTIVYLAHCGFNVPASFAEIPLVDRIIVAQSGSSLYSTEGGFER